MRVGMSEPSFPIHSISDTAHWVAYFRARESERPDALFHDPYAERLAGARGFQIANTLAEGNKYDWAWVARTYLFDTFLLREIRNGVQLVVNLAAGLDARPYRMQLPTGLQWVEVDLPDIIDYKEDVLSGDKPICHLERIPLDLSNRVARRALFAELNRRGMKIVVLTEGLLIYLTTEEVGSLASDLSAGGHFQSWAADLASPGQLKFMQRTTGKQLSAAGVAFRFGPPEGPNFFVPYGWQPVEVQGLLKTAAQFKRPPRRTTLSIARARGRTG